MTDVITFKFFWKRDEEKKEVSITQFPQTNEVLLCLELLLI